MRRLTAGIASCDIENERGAIVFYQWRGIVVVHIASFACSADYACRAEISAWPRAHPEAPDLPSLDTGGGAPIYLPAFSLGVPAYLCCV